MDWTLYNNYLTVLGETERDELLQDTKDYFNQSAVNNLGYYEDIIYNGEKEKRRFLIQRTESYNKVKITAFPDEPLFSGDLLKCKNETTTKVLRVLIICLMTILIFKHFW